MEHPLRVRRVTAYREVCLAVSLREITVARAGQAVPEAVDHAIATERRRRDDQLADSVRMPDRQLHSDLTSIAEPENVDGPDREFSQQCGDAVRGTRE